MYHPQGFVNHAIKLSYDNASLRCDTESGFTLNAFHLDHAFPGNEGDPSKKSMDSLYWALLRKNPPNTPIMMDNKPENARKTQVFIRGNWKVKGEVVSPGIPKVLSNSFNLTKPNRMGMVEWMTDKRNPLVSRTLVNRLWEQLFGTGIVETLEDFGSQGTLPSHPELLD